MVNLKPVFAAVVLGMCMLGSCRSTTPKPGAEPAAQEPFVPAPGPVIISGQVTRAQLGDMTSAYADRYMTLIATACDAAIAENASADQRRLAHQFKVSSVSGVYDIATNPDTYTRLLDMTFVITLQSMVWIDDDHATEVFGDRGEILVGAIRRAREEIWDIAGRVIPSTQLADFDRLIWRWKQEHEGVRLTTFVRFDQIAASREKSRVVEAKRSGGLLAPVDDARREVEEARELAERVFFYAKRAAMLAEWQAEAMVNDVLIKPDVQNIPTAVGELSSALDALATSLRQLPLDLELQRVATVDDVDRAVAERSEAMIERVEKAVGESTDRIEHAAASSVNRVEHLIDRVFWRAVLFAAILFVMAGLYRVWLIRIARRETQRKP